MDLSSILWDENWNTNIMRNFQDIPAPTYTGVTNIPERGSLFPLFWFHKQIGILTNTALFKYILITMSAKNSYWVESQNDGAKYEGGRPIALSKS